MSDRQNDLDDENNELSVYLKEKTGVSVFLAKEKLSEDVSVARIKIKCARPEFIHFH